VRSQSDTGLCKDCKVYCENKKNLLGFIETVKFILRPHRFTGFFRDCKVYCGYTKRYWVV
jgi:hypothetical protein